MTPTNSPLTPDALANHWSLRVLPRWARPYGRLMRLERPTGWPLLLWPCIFSSLLASIALGTGPAWAHLGLFFIGAVVMRGAGCTLNDIIDRDIDARVARTAARPIPSGEVSVRAALAFMAAQLFVGLMVLLSFNTFTIFVGASALIVVAIYPFMKRITNWPQVVLGLAFSWGALVGWSAQMGELSLPAFACFAACVAWIIGYDTIYAFQDLEDDALVGIGSSAQAVGTAAPTFVGACFALTIVILALAYVSVGVGIPAYLGLLAAAAHFVWQLRTLDITDPDGCRRLFQSNAQVGGLIALGLLADVFV